MAPKLAYVVADVHVGNHAVVGGETVGGINERCARILTVLSRVSRLAAAKKAELVVAGDLFDRDNAPPPLVRGVMDAFEPLGGRARVIVGNHDMRTMHPTDNALAPLKEMAITEPSMTLSGIKAIPFDPRPVAAYLGESLDKLADREGVVMCGHFGVADERTPRELQHAADAIHVDQLVGIVAPRGIKTVIVGNWHNHEEWELDGVKVVQLGALVPTGWNNPGIDGYGGLAVVNTETGEVKWHSMPGPRFLAVPFHDFEAVCLQNPGFDLYVKVACSLEQKQQLDIIAARVRSALADNKVKPTSLVHYESDLLAPRSNIASVGATIDESTSATFTDGVIRAWLGVRAPDKAERLAALALKYIKEQS